MGKDFGWHNDLLGDQGYLKLSDLDPAGEMRLSWFWGRQIRPSKVSVILGAEELL